MWILRGAALIRENTETFCFNVHTSFFTVYAQAYIGIVVTVLVQLSFYFEF